jgi:hypothetical protein
MEFEYKRTTYEFGLSSELESELNKEGKEGWKVIYYNEIKPSKFGEKFKSIVLYIRQKSDG